MKIVKPKSLNKGDVIGIVAPASPPLDSKKLNSAIKYLESLGYRIELGKHIFDQYGYLAGKDADRAKDINKFFANKNIKAIFSVRGGYGSMRILPHLDYELIKKNPKIFVGYSDITAIQLALLRKCNMLTISGFMLEPGLSKKMDSVVEEIFWTLLTSTSPIGDVLRFSKKEIIFQNSEKVRGMIIGGNLSILTSLVGTNYLPDFKNKILILEDIDERPYRIDRMLYQLRLSGVLKKIKCVVLGDFSTCVEQSKRPTLLFNEIINDVFGKIPIVMNFEFGHIETSLPIAFGIKTEITPFSFSFLESAVIR